MFNFVLIPHIKNFVPKKYISLFRGLPLKKLTFHTEAEVKHFYTLHERFCTTSVLVFIFVENRYQHLIAWEYLLSWFATRVILRSNTISLEKVCIKILKDLNVRNQLT